MNWTSKAFTLLSSLDGGVFPLPVLAVGVEVAATSPTLGSRLGTVLLLLAISAIMTESLGFAPVSLVTGGGSVAYGNALGCVTPEAVAGGGGCVGGSIGGRICSLLVGSMPCPGSRLPPAAPRCWSSSSDDP